MLFELEHDTYFLHGVLIWNYFYLMSVVFQADVQNHDRIDRIYHVNVDFCSKGMIYETHQYQVLAAINKYTGLSGESEKIYLF